VTFSTSNAPDIVVGGVFTTGSETTISASGSYSLINSVVSGPTFADSDIYLSSTGSQTVGFTWTGTSRYWITFGIAIDPPAPAGAQSTQPVANAQQGELVAGENPLFGMVAFAGLFLFGRRSLGYYLPGRIADIQELVLLHIGKFIHVIWSRNSERIYSMNHGTGKV
jgi:hypothetical protein